MEGRSERRKRRRFPRRRKRRKDFFFFFRSRCWQTMAGKVSIFPARARTVSLSLSVIFHEKRNAREIISRVVFATDQPLLVHAFLVPLFSFSRNREREREIRVSPRENIGSADLAFR